MTIAFCVPYNLISFKNFGTRKRSKTIKTHVDWVSFFTERNLNLEIHVESDLFVWIVKFLNKIIDIDFSDVWKWFLTVNPKNQVLKVFIAAGSCLVAFQNCVNEVVEHLLS